MPRIVDTLGGSKLYGDDPTVALRELIQNAADAVQARRRYEKRSADWGRITVDLLSESNKVWLVVEDNGIGMSEHVLTGPLLDFGTSFWRSSLATEEFPGLMAAGMRAIGRFGMAFSQSSCSAPLFACTPGVATRDERQVGYWNSVTAQARSQFCRRRPVLPCQSMVALEWRFC